MNHLQPAHVPQGRIGVRGHSGVHELYTVLEHGVSNNAGNAVALHVANAEADAAGNRREVNDVATPLCLKDGEAFVDELKVSVQVQIDAHLPCLLCHLAKAHWQRDRRQ